ncbi:zinc-dependent alcohol dehydrogenase family protein [Labrys wisconsinensis]|uniref:enoyl-[acyl-carrier-protein] reductase n=1 Tax=Labrys wisconsinensis TaxID=425677 RepID=A0ABU0JEK7_9HYPH|nr:zinc-dependent alcohol dehydrogenase family protein [Labrys wisconsinensis]MDQ0472704.1 NADPH:quinone reductase-like Zn-dependent oxidoreductase [Labrys wisconsinensis]
MKAVQIFRHGPPLDVVELVDVAEPNPPGAGEVLIEMLYSPINPYDLRTMRGVVPAPPLPAIIGAEGVARVLSADHDVANVKAGDLVHLPNGYYGWRERLVVPAQPLFPLPPNAGLQQLSMLRVNPPTAALLLSEYVDLQPGDWVIQNAANSGVGRSVIAFAKARGFKTVNIVRRLDVVADIKAIGGDVVLVESEGLAAKVVEATGNTPIKLGLEGVGGPSTAALSGTISSGGTMVLYSAMSEQPGVANQLDVIFRDVAIRGFWLAYPRLHTSGRFAAALREAADLIAQGSLHVPVAAAFPLTEIREAISAAGKGAKVLLELNSVVG